MFSWILAGLVFAGVLLDAGVSVKRLGQLGLSAELNPLVRWTCEKLGPWQGMSISIVAPWSVMLVSSAVFHWDCWLSFLAGLRLLWGIFQLDSLVHPKV